MQRICSWIGIRRIIGQSTGSAGSLLSRFSVESGLSHPQSPRPKFMALSRLKLPPAALLDLESLELAPQFGSTSALSDGFRMGLGTLRFGLGGLDANC
jgi:hypothetical protein